MGIVLVMHPVCGANRVEHAVAITKNVAQASDSAWGWGSPRGVPPTLRRSGVFPACGTRFAEQIGCITHRIC
jgi:hypothetical protein